MKGESMDKFCSKCGQRLMEHSRFCTSCGAPISTTEESEHSQSNQQIPHQSQMNGSQAMNHMYEQQPQSYHSYHGQIHNIPQNVSSKNSLALAFSIVAIVLSVLGSILFGIYLSIPSMILSIVSVVMAVDVRKKSNGVLGQAALAIGIIAIVFASLFTIGYLIFDTTGYGKYGWIGGYYKSYHDYNNTIDDILRDFGL